jgi:hypothetical protein
MTHGHTPTVDEYWKAVQEKVCAKCIDSDGSGACRLSGIEACALRQHFPRIVDTVLTVHSERIDPYIDALRSNICAECTHQSPDGKCSLRSDLDCGLDRYFPLIVETIERLRMHPH